MLSRLNTNKEFYIIEESIEVEHNEAVHIVSIKLTRRETLRLSAALTGYDTNIEKVFASGEATEDDLQKIDERFCRATSNFVNLDFIDDIGLRANTIYNIAIELSKNLPR